MDIYAFIPTTVLGCYAIIILTLLNVKRTKLKKLFLLTLGVYACWALGSVGMRLSSWPSSVFWFEMALFGMFLIPASTLFYMEQYLYGKTGMVTKLMLAGSVVFYAANLFSGGWMIPMPKAVTTNEDTVFIYDGAGPQAILPFAAYAVITAYFGWLLWKAVKEKLLRRKEFVIVFGGKALLMLGNILIFVEPFRSFPLNALFALVDSFGMMLMVGMSPKICSNREIFQKNMKVFTYSLSAILTLVFSVPSSNYMSIHLPDWLGEYKALLFSLVLLLFYMLMYCIIDSLTQTLYMKEGEIQLIRINEFRAKCSRTLDVKEIQELIRNTAVQWLAADWAEMLVWEEETHTYGMTHPFPYGGRLQLPEDNAFLRYLSETKQGIIVDRIAAGDLDEECMKRVESMRKAGIAVVQPFFDGKQMYAVLVVSREKRKISTQEKRALGMLAEISMDAIRNAELYSEVYWESRNDILTGVGNRKYFYEVLSELRAKAEPSPLSIVMLKLDDYRVFNQVYGVVAGDAALKRVAALLQETVQENDRVFRYGATEFVVLLENREETQAKEIAETIRLNVMKLDDVVEKQQMMLTVSVGVSGVPSAAEVDDKTIDRCMIAVYMAQRAGQNCTVVFGEQKGESIVSLNKRIYKEYEAVFRALTSAVDAKDHYTAAHSQNVSYYATEVAKALHMSEEEIEIIKEAGLLHDIGKIGIPEAILMKPDRLTEEEYEVMKSHVEQAVSILHHLPGMEYVLPAVLGHHERYDGKGYPRGIAGEEIPRMARILSIVDSFDAMVSVRPYKPSLPLNYAKQQILKGKGSQFDAELADLFVQLIEEGKIQIRRVESSKSRSYFIVGES